MRKLIFITALMAFFAAPGCRKHIAEKTPVASDAVILDVRTAGEYKQGHLQTAINIPHDAVSNIAPEMIKDKNTPVYIYCRSGRRVRIAIEALQKIGYSNLHDCGSMEEAAKQLGLPLEK